MRFTLIACGFAASLHLAVNAQQQDVNAQQQNVQAQQTININSELLAAARGGTTTAVKALLEQGAAVNSRNRLGDSPLLIAAKNGYTPMALLVLQHGADVNQRNLSGISPLMAAAFNGDVEL